MDTIITKVRNIIDDLSSNVVDIFTYTTSTIFTLTETNPTGITTVYINNTTTTNYTYNSTTKKVTISASLTSGDTIQIDYTAYLNYSDTEIKGYINSALYQLGIHNYENYEVESGDNIYPTPTSQEEKLIAVISALLIDKPVRNIRLPDISYSFPEEDSLDKKISKVIAAFKRNGKIGDFSLI